MDKNILSQYIDACELIKETEEEIKKLNRKKKTVIQHVQKKFFESIGIILKRFYEKIRTEIDDPAICAGRGCF